MDIKIRQYAEEDVKETIAIWNEVVKEGIAFPQKETLTESLSVEMRFIRENDKEAFILISNTS